MAKKLYLLDGMALVYRAHFALIARPIFTSKGVNTSALYGFTQTLLDIIKNQQPTHLAVAFDTDAPTQRHHDFPEYKATRETMPEDLSAALPHVRRLLDAFHVPVLICDGYEADDIIGTLVRRAEKEGFTSYMVTPDKDFGQLIDANTFIYKPSRMGDGVEILGLPEIQKRWGIKTPDQVVDILALMGDSTDNIPGVPGIGEKTAIKLISQFSSLENLLAKTGELTGKMRENLQTHREKALLSKKLATINCEAPCPIDLETLKVTAMDEDKVKELMVEFEFNSIGKRLFGENFKAGRGFQGGVGGNAKAAGTINIQTEDLVLFSEGEVQSTKPIAANLKKLGDVPHDYRIAQTEAERLALANELSAANSVSIAVEASSNDPREARPIGIAFALAPQRATYVPLPKDVGEIKKVLEPFKSFFGSDRIEKVGHDLKFDLRVLKAEDIDVAGNMFDVQIAHSLTEPDMSHRLGYLAEAFLGYTPVPIAKLAAGTAGEQIELAALPVEKVAEGANEKADLCLQLRGQIEPLLKQKGQERVFYEIEAPLEKVLMEMEFEGIRLDATAMAQFAMQLTHEIESLEKEICKLAGSTFNINSPRQLGQILFEVLKICEKPKKTKTGQYATDEQTLMALAPDNPIVQKLLEHRTASKLKSTYADALPATIWAKTGRVHTTFNQVATSTGRLNSENPNLQNIPIRTERGQEIRKAFVPRDKEFLLLSADYSQIELRIIAALSNEAGLLEAFRTGADVHTATAARVYNVFFDMVTAEMRRKAKMVNYGIAYGISAFGLAQRLSIPRKEAAEIIDQYFKQFPGIARFMDETISRCRERGYVETVTGRRRYIRDIRSSNATVRGGAERNAINAPIQGTAADMIKIAMVNIHRELVKRRLKSRMLLQVHDELVFDLQKSEEQEVRELVEEKMKSAIPLEVPIVVEMGTGTNWLEAH